MCTAGHFQLSLLKVCEKLQLHASHGEDREKYTPCSQIFIIITFKF